MPILAQRPKTDKYLIPEMLEAWPKIPRRYGAGECPRVTTILDVALPNHALVRWAADVEAAAQREAWSEAILRAGPSLTDKQAFVDAKLGAVREHKKLADSAANLGSYAHALVEHHLYSMLGQVNAPPLPPEELNRDQIQAARMAATAGKEWIEEVGLVPEAIECTVYDRELRTAGTLDVKGHVPDRKVIVDWKSSRGIYLNHLIQVAGAYHKMAATEKGTDSRIVQLPKTLESYQQMITDYGRAVHAVRITEDGEQPLFAELWLSCVRQFGLIKQGEAALRRINKNGKADKDAVAE